MEFLQGNYFFIGASEQKGDRSVTAVLERKSFAKRSFRSQFLERKGNGYLYGGTERNRSNQTGSWFCGGMGRQPRLWNIQSLGAVPPYGMSRINPRA